MPLHPTDPTTAATLKAVAAQAVIAASAANAIFRTLLEKGIISGEEAVALKETIRQQTRPTVVDTEENAADSILLDKALDHIFPIVYE